MNLKSQQKLPEGLEEFSDIVSYKKISEIEIHTDYLSVEEYSSNEKAPKDFPRPTDYFVFADHLIDLPVLAADFSITKGTHGQVIGYSYDRFWIIADSIQQLSRLIQDNGVDAVWSSIRESNNALS